MHRHSSKRPGVSSIIGSIFFVLIMIVGITSLVSIFNSFTAYNTQVNKAGNAQVQAQGTSLSISGSSFGAFPPSTTSNFNVATTGCTTTSTLPTNQQGLLYAAGMWWDFFTCNSSFLYSTSFDGVTWEPATVIPNLISGYTVGPYFDTDVMGSTIYLAISSHSTLRFQLGIGTLASGGTGSAPAGTITWTSPPAEVVTGAQPTGPIQISVDVAGNEWVAVVQGTCSTATNCQIQIYERQGSCSVGTPANYGWEPNSCSSSTAPTNYAPTSPALNALAPNANMILLSPPSILASTGAILTYETAGTAIPAGQTGTISVITQATLGGTPGSGWVAMTLTGITDYSLTSSSAVFIGNTMNFAGLQNAGTGQTTGALKFWTLPFTSMTAATASAEQTIEGGTARAWMAALEGSGTTLALFDAYPTAGTIQYYTSSNLGSSGLWSSAITLESAETNVNNLSPAAGGFAVTWANSVPNVRFAALSTVTVSNNSPFSVHMVDLYVENPATNSLVAHYYVNSTEDFDYWVSQGSATTIPIRFIWTAATSYLVTVGTDTGVTTQLTVTSPPVAAITCPPGYFPGYQIAPTQACSSVLAAASPAVSFTSSPNTCTDSTSGSTQMMDLGVTYTTSSSSSGSIYAILTFNVLSPSAASGVNSKWQLTYGTGTAPLCHGGVAGTATAQQYTLNTESTTALGTSQSVGVTITGLSPNTAYWFDVQVLDSTGDSWVYSLASLSVTDILNSGLQAPQVGYSSNTGSCPITTSTLSMAGFGATYTTGSSNFQGDIYATLSLDVKSPGTTGLNSQWRIAYGSGAAPGCGNTATTGTAVGNQYQVTTVANVVLEMGQSESVVITGLAPGTTYWFDVQVTDSSGAQWTYSNPTLAVVEMPTTKNLAPNVNFASLLPPNAKSCGRNTASNRMAGFKANYTTLSSSTGSIFVSLTFKVATPGTINLNSIWQVAYGTLAAPACNAAFTGTTVGKQYTINTEFGAAGGMGQTIGFVLTGLSKGTQYWFDVQATETTTAVWTYSNPAISVMDIMPADFVHSNTVFSSNGISCARNTATTLMAGFATYYTTTSLGTGNIKVVLTFNIANPGSAVNTKWQVAYGTVVAPACNAVAAGTIVGNQYTWTSQSNSNPGGNAQTAGFSLVGLTPATSYWFDVRALDSDTTVWTYSNPEISVLEVP